MDIGPILKLHLLTLVPALAAAAAALILPKGSGPHRLAGRSALGLGVLSVTAALLHGLPAGDTPLVLGALAAFYAGLAGRGWIMPGGPARTYRALTATALIGCLALAATSAGVAFGFSSELLRPDDAPAGFVFGLAGTLAARRNVLDFEMDLTPDDRQIRHGRHMAAMAVILSCLLISGVGVKFGFDRWPWSGLPLGLGAAALLIHRRHISG